MKFFRINNCCRFCLIYIGTILYSCKQQSDASQFPIEVNEPKSEIVKAPDLSGLEDKFVKAGLMNIIDLDSGILVDLKYSTTDNFIGRDLYGDLINAYLQPDVVEMLVKAQSFLKTINNSLTLLVYDAARPLQIQQIMWDSLDVPLQQKRNFLSDPAKGSLHNYGSAVDVTIADLKSNALDMGTPYDFIGELAYPTLEAQMLQKGMLTTEQIENRKLLRYVMFSAGFTGIESEWWHFNAYTREEAKVRYKIIE